MKVTHEAIGALVSEMYATTATIKDDHVGFGLCIGDYKLEIIICLEEYPSLDDEEEIDQSMHFCLWFCHKDGSRFNLSMYTLVDILVFCNRLKEEISWGELMPWQAPAETIEITLNRTVDISIEDIELARTGSKKSALIRNLHHLITDGVELSPLLYGYVTEQIKSATQLEQLLTGTEGSC